MPVHPQKQMKWVRRGPRAIRPCTSSAYPLFIFFLSMQPQLGVKAPLTQGNPQGWVAMQTQPALSPAASPQEGFHFTQREFPYVQDEPMFAQQNSYIHTSEQLPFNFLSMDICFQCGGFFISSQSQIRDMVQTFPLPL